MCVVGWSETGDISEAPRIVIPFGWGILPDNKQTKTEKRAADNCSQSPLRTPGKGDLGGAASASTSAVISLDQSQHHL